MKPPGMTHSGSHRPEIDGLRSIAVLAVVFYHFGVPGPRGGFVGVDIFFVISGFLIGGILWREQRMTGRLALGRFFARRIRRLAPAYFAMALGSLAVAAFVLLPFEFREFSKGLIAATVYLSNILFFRDFGYFDTAAEEKILLHTWSLSVEEQFYLFLPIVFLLLASRARWLAGALVLLAVVSLLSSVVITPLSQPATFYLFPFRAWELLGGVLLAIAGHEYRLSWKYGALWSWGGLGLVVGAIMWIEPTQQFPGWQAIVPVLGALLLILNGRDCNLVNRALSSPLPVFVGLISYSLYLWHWPVLTLSRYVRGDYSGVLETSAWLVVTFGLAVLSWRYIERPVRVAQNLTSKIVVGTALVASMATLASAAAIFKNDGFAGRFSAETRVHIGASQDFLQDFSRCTVPDSGPFDGLEICPIGPENQEPSVLIWGDSHLRAYYEGLADAADKNGQAALTIWRAGCPPLFDLEKVENTATDIQNRACHHANSQIRQALDKTPSVQSVLLIGRWSYYATGAGVGRDVGNEIQLSSAGSSPQNQPQSDIFLNAMQATIATLSQRGLQVSVLRQVPEIPDYDSRQVAKGLAFGSLTGARLNDLISVDRMQAEKRAEAADQLLRDLSVSKMVGLVDPWPYLCNSTTCRALADGTGQYFDNNHITNSAARRMSGMFDSVFAGSRSGSTND